MRHIRILVALLAVLFSAFAISVEMADVVYAYAAEAAEPPATASGEAVDGEEHPQPDVTNQEPGNRNNTQLVIVSGPRPLIIDGRSFRPPLQYRFKA